MKESIKKIVLALLVTFLLSSTVLVMFGQAQETTVSLLVAPNPVGVNQVVSVVALTQPPTESMLLTVQVRDADFNLLFEYEHLTDSQGVALFSYTPTETGSYTIDLFLPWDEFASATVFLIVQEEAVPVGPIVPPGGPVTPGDYVTVFPDPEDSRVSLYFEHIASSGTVTVSKTATPPAGVPPLTEIKGLYYDFDVTFTFTGPVVVGLPYDAGLTNEESLSIWHYEGGVVGDVNGDNKVDWRDLLLIGLAMGSKPGTRRWNPACDLNGDKRVDFSDLFIALRNYGRSTRTWVDVTRNVDTANNIVYGSTTSFPPFGIRYK